MDFLLHSLFYLLVFLLVFQPRRQLGAVESAKGKLFRASLERKPYEGLHVTLRKTSSERRWTTESTASATISITKQEAQMPRTVRIIHGAITAFGTITLGRLPELASMTLLLPGGRRRFGTVEAGRSTPATNTR